MQTRMMGKNMETLFKRPFLPPAILLGLLLFLSGCANSAARRDARRAAFEPLRPDPAYRLLPDRPLYLKSPAKAKSKPADADVLPENPAQRIVTPPVIWLANDLAEAGFENTASRFHGQTVEVYFIAKKPFKGTLLAVGRNDKNQEITRVKVPVEFAAEDARFVTFELPGKLAPNELKLVVIDRLAR